MSHLGFIFRPVSGLFLVFSIFYCNVGFAAGTVKALGDDVAIYSGPGTKYRIMRMARASEALPVSPRLYQGPDGDFYKVLIKTKTGNRVGFIPVSERVTLEGATVQEQFSEAESQAHGLSESHLQIGVQVLKSERYLWTIGYQRYFSSEAYWRAFAGNLLDETTGSAFAAGELGLDQTVHGKFSLSTFVAAGLLSGAVKNQIFAGSEKVNMYFHGGFGVRYNADEYSAVHFSLFQVALLNQNNSALSLGAGVTVEVGL